MKPNWKVIRKKWLRRMAFGTLCTLVFVFLLEVFYRNQWIDTYKRELRALNAEVDPIFSKKRVLVMGDSFTAAPNSWVNSLRTRHPDMQIINSAVPGTSIFQANLMLAGRLKNFRPDLLIYQVYVGNDLFDLRYPLNWSEIGFFRNIYWAAANHLRGLGWLNYAMGQMKRIVKAPDFQQGKVDEGRFDPSKYSERERLYLRAEPNLIGNQVLLRGGREADMTNFLALIQEFLSTATQAHVPVIVLVVPHCAQVHPRYTAHMKLVGADDMDTPDLRNSEFPFFQKIKTLERKEVQMINLLPALRECEETDQSTYYLHDGHLNDAGQATLAKVVEDNW
jgi:hypothetical protein